MNPVMIFEELKCVSVQLTHEGHIAWLTLNRPDSYNALNAEMIKELHAVIDILEHSGDVKASVTGQRTGVRVVILQGSGKSFCAGIDIKVRSPSINTMCLIKSSQMSINTKIGHNAAIYVTYRLLTKTRSGSITIFILRLCSLGWLRGFEIFLNQSLVL